jgi:hypothetical protein
MLKNEFKGINCRITVLKTKKSILSDELQAITAKSRIRLDEN